MNTTMLIIFDVIVLFFSLSVHESAHAWAAHLLGDDTAEQLGRISLNPIRHIDIVGTIIVPGFLLLVHSPILFGWAKPVPVNPMNLKNPVRDYGWVSFAGPLSNMILALISFILLKIAIILHLPQATYLFLFMLLGINVILAVFNLIPVFPLDGGGVLNALLPESARHFMMSIRKYGFLILLILLGSGLIDRMIQLIFTWLMKLLQ